MPEIQKGHAVNDKVTAGATKAEKPKMAENKKDTAENTDAAPKKEAPKKEAPKPHEIKDPKEWARKYWDKYGAGHHRGLSKTAMAERLNALLPYLEKSRDNEALKKHIDRLIHLLGPK
jgi:hypothetical protein